MPTDSGIKPWLSYWTLWYLLRGEWVMDWLTGSGLRGPLQSLHLRISIMMIISTGDCESSLQSSWAGLLDWVDQFLLWSCSWQICILWIMWHSYHLVIVWSVLKLKFPSTADKLFSAFIYQFNIKKPGHQCIFYLTDCQAQSKCNHQTPTG